MTQGAKERRRFMRFNTSLKAEYWAKGPSMLSGETDIRDFCREGVRVHLPKPVARGEHVDLSLKVPGDNIPIFATGEVAWTRESSVEFGSDVGLRLRSIAPLDLARLLDFVYAKWLGAIQQKV